MGKRKIINHPLVQGQGNPTLVAKIYNVHDSASLVVDCKSSILGWDFPVPVQRGDRFYQSQVEWIN